MTLRHKAIRSHNIMLYEHIFIFYGDEFRQDKPYPLKLEKV